MLVAAFAIAAVALSPAEFPAQPIPAEVRRGAELAQKRTNELLRDVSGARNRRSVECVFSGDRVAIGRWSNGYSKQSVEWAIRLSPGLMSRWLGFLQAREYWGDDELLSRWNAVRARLDGRLTFVVQLAAFPKLPTLDVGDPAEPRPEEVDDVRFVLTGQPAPHPMRALRLARWQARERSPLRDYKWWLDLDLGCALAPEFERDQAQPPSPFGDYHMAWYVVWTDERIDVGKALELRVLCRRKERTARFSLPRDAD